MSWNGGFARCEDKQKLDWTSCVSGLGQRQREKTSQRSAAAGGKALTLHRQECLCYKENGRRTEARRPKFSGMKRILQRLNVSGLQALGAADDFKFDRLAVVQAAVPIRLDRGEMDENVLPGLALDESKAFAGVEPLHCSLFFIHFLFLFSSKKAI